MVSVACYYFYFAYDVMRVIICLLILYFFVIGQSAVDASH